MASYREQIAELLAPLTGLEVQALSDMLEVPPNPEMGDFALPCFPMARTMRKAPPVIAATLAEQLNASASADAADAGRPSYLSRVEAVKGYLNFFIDRAAFTERVLEAVRGAGEGYGSSREGEGKTVCIDYSSINIAKRFHIGHLSTTAIGNALCKIYRFLGWRAVGINHLGDWGTQFGKLIAAYKHWGSREMVEEGGVNAMVALYVRFHEEAKAHPELEDEGRAWFKRIEEGDQEATEIFAWFKEVTMEDVKAVYAMLGVEFDAYTGESFYADKMGRVIDELKAKNLLIESQGAQVVDLEEWKLPPCLIVKSDGATLYHTRDIAAALYRQDTYHFDKCLYVVAYQQNLHFQQLFKVIELMGYAWYTGLEHVSFGMISYEGRALSTRDGYVVYLDELLERAVEKARAVIEEKSPGLADKDETARQVGVGAVVFSALQNNRIKDIDFRWDRALNFDGETAPYVQYTHARAGSVLEKAGNRDLSGAIDYAALGDDEAQAVLRLLDGFPAVIREAADRNEPSLITRHTVDLAQAYNRYYYEHRILDENDPTGEKARLALTSAVRTVLKTGLGLLGIEAPAHM